MEGMYGVGIAFGVRICVIAILKSTVL